MALFLSLIALPTAKSHVKCQFLICKVVKHSLSPECSCFREDVSSVKFSLYYFITRVFQRYIV